jgi:bacterioferritin
VGETVEEVLRADLALEHEAIPLLKDAAEYARSVKDHTSAGLFEDILKNEEEHVDFLETQFEMIERMGLHNYCQLQSAPAGDS